MSIRTAFLALACSVALATPASTFAGDGQCGADQGMANKEMMTRGTIAATASAAGNFGTLVAAAKAAGLVPALSGKTELTVFAPTDEAFAKLPKGTVEKLLKPENKAMLASILKYHVVPGKVLAKQVVGLEGATTLNGQRIDIAVSDAGVRVDGAQVTKTDILCSNGVIHVIDSVILPSNDSIVKTAQSAGSFGTLLAAAKAAGLAKVLGEGGPFTVFAPTDEAFAALPEGTVESLLKPENRDQLVSILKYHVVSGRVFAADAKKAGKAPTLFGKPIAFSKNGKNLQVQGATIVATDIDASNGVIHVIDRVLLPEMSKKVR